MYSVRLHHFNAIISTTHVNHLCKDKENILRSGISGWCDYGQISFLAMFVYVYVSKSFKIPTGHIVLMNQDDGHTVQDTVNST